VSRTFATAGAEEQAELAQTRYGQRYLALVAPVGVAALL
jgi:uncharacterized glyoxalase superfamily protein PhnB